MKVRKILPLVLVAPLLASCGGIKGSEPSFDSYSNKVEFAAYSEAVVAAVAKSKIGAEALVAKAGSFEAKNSTYSESSAKGKQGGEDIESLSKSKEETEMRFSAENLVAAGKVVSASERAMKNGESESSYLTSEESERKYQVVDYKDAKHLAQIDEKQKEYRPGSVVTDEAVAMDAFAKSQTLGGAATMILSYMVPSLESLSDEEKAAYSFYNDNDGKLFTMVCEYTAPAEDVFSAKDSSVKVGTVNMSQKGKAQFKLEDDKIRLAVSSSMSYTYEFTATDWALMYGQPIYVKAEDKIESESVNYVESTIEFKSVDLAKVDLAEFVVVE